MVELCNWYVLYLVLGVAAACTTSETIKAKHEKNLPSGAVK